MSYISQAFHLLMSGDEELRQIIAATLVMSFFSTGISALLGIPCGVAIGRAGFRGKGMVMRLLHTLTGLPPVVAGLIVFMLFRAVGPFGSLKLMFTLPAMVIAQVLLITPVVCSLVSDEVSIVAPGFIQTAKGIGMTTGRQILLLVNECAEKFIGIILVGFGRSIAEVGAVSLVGGNIQYKTRVMTTAIMLETNKGNFDTAIALGIILMLISLAVNTVAYTVKEKMKT